MTWLSNEPTRCEWADYVTVDECAEAGCGLPQEAHRHPSLMAHEFKALDREVQCSNAVERRLTSLDRYSPDEGTVVQWYCGMHADIEWVVMTNDDALTGLLMEII